MVLAVALARALVLVRVPAPVRVTGLVAV